MISARDFVFDDDLKSELSAASSSSTEEQFFIFKIENEKQTKDDLNLESLKLISDQNLNKLYKRNLIRYEIIKKLNKELNFTRASLLESMQKNDQNLSQCRSRVEWLEKEIEKLILTNRIIKFPLQKKVLNDNSLVVKREIFVYEESPEEIEASRRGNKNL